MIIKCIECKTPMTESQKLRPKDLPPQNKWIVCRTCKKGVEVIGGDESTVPAVGVSTSELEFEEITYVTIKQTKDGIFKYKYSDKERSMLINEEKLG